MRIKAINTVPIRYINKSTKTQNSYISNQISFGISEHERLSLIHILMLVILSGIKFGGIKKISEKNTL